MLSVKRERRLILSLFVRDKNFSHAWVVANVAISLKPKGSRYRKPTFWRAWIKSCCLVPENCRLSFLGPSHYLLRKGNIYNKTSGFIILNSRNLSSNSFVGKRTKWECWMHSGQMVSIDFRCGSEEGYAVPFRFPAAEEWLWRHWYCRTCRYLACLYPHALLRLLKWPVTVTSVISPSSFISSVFLAFSIDSVILSNR